MIAFKLWYMCVGSVITAWVLLAISITFTISTIWKTGRKARITMAMLFAFLAVAMLIYLVFPFNYRVIYNMGGI